MSEYKDKHWKGLYRPIPKLLKWAVSTICLNRRHYRECLLEDKTFQAVAIENGYNRLWLFENWSSPHPKNWPAALMLMRYSAPKLLIVIGLLICLPAWIIKMLIRALRVGGRDVK